MNVNYHNEDYTGEIFNIVICSIIVIFIIFWGIYTTGGKIDTEILVICGIFIALIGSVLIFSIKRYITKKQKRNLNLFIMKNGKKIKGKISLIYDDSTHFVNFGYGSIHNVVAEVSYNIDNEDKVISVNNLCISYYDLEKYKNKIVDIYIYNNMSYVDIVN